VGSNAQMEQTQVAFTHLLGSSQAAGDYLKQLWNFAATTPFEFNQVTAAAQQMIAFGFSAKDVLPDLTDMGDALSSMGQIGGDSIQRITMIFGQMHAAGKIHAQDMMQLTSMGIPGWKMLADAMHLSVAQVQDLSQKGLIPADKAIQMLLDGMHKTFGGAMQGQSQTFSGLISTLHDNIEGAWRAFTGPLFEAAKAGLMQLGNLISSKQFQDFAANMGKQVGAFLGPLRSALSIGAQAFQPFLAVIKSVSPFVMEVGKFIGFLAQQFSILLPPALKIGQQLFEGVGHVIGILMQAMSGQLIPAIQRLVAAIVPIIQGILQWIASSGILNTIFSILGVAINIVVGALSILITIITALIVFFSQTEVGIAAFRAILIILGIAIALIGTIILTIVIPAFIAWFAEAILVVIAHIIAFAPIVLITL